MILRAVSLSLGRGACPLFLLPGSTWGGLHLQVLLHPPPTCTAVTGVPVTASWPVSALLGPAANSQPTPRLGECDALIGQAQVTCSGEGWSQR